MIELSDDCLSITLDKPIVQSYDITIVDNGVIVSP